MARVRRLNISYASGGLLTTSVTVPPAEAWNLETDLEPRFAKRNPVQLMPASFLIPRPTMPHGWETVLDSRYIKRRFLPSAPFSFWQPTPSVYATTNASQTAGNNTIFFAAVPGMVSIGMEVYDLTTSCIAAGTTVLAKSATSVTLSIGLTNNCNSGDRIFFTYG